MTELYNQNSPYFNTPQKTWYLDYWKGIKIEPQNDDKYIEISPKYHERPDLLSYDIYGTSDFWWIFILRNRNLMNDPTFDLKSGMKIWIPTKSYVQRKASGK